MNIRTRIRVNSSTSIALAAALAFTLPVPAYAQQQTYAFDIPASNLANALSRFGRTTRQQLVYNGAQARQARSTGVNGTMTAQAALAQMLQGSGFSFRVGNAGVMIIERGAIPGSGEATSSSREEDDGSGSDEIVVTAQKREERLLDVPAPVTVISAAGLVDRAQLRLQDYYTQIPGLNFTVSGDVGLPLVAFRGVTTGSTAVNPTVSVVVDDIPFGASSTAASSIAGYAPDFDPSELERIEALRGPQGTLYGASSLGGLLKYVTVDPTMDRVRGRVQLGASVAQEGGMGYSLRGALNAPISESLAVRISGSARRDPGYIDNLSTGERDINDVQAYSGRLALLWNPLETISIRLSALYQQSERGGTSDSYLPSGPRPDVDDLEQATLINTGGSKDRLLALSAILNANLLGGQFISLTGYSNRHGFFSGDSSAGGLAGDSVVRFGPGITGLDIQATTQVEKLSQELRFTAPLTDQLELIVGGFFTDENVTGHADWYAVNPTTGAIGGTYQILDIEGGYREFATFANLAYQVTDQFDIQVGGRASWNRVEGGALTSVGPYNLLLGRPTPSFISPSFVSRDSPTTFLVTARYKPSTNVTLYSRVASGYRTGGPNTNTQLMLAGLPTQFTADTTINYEVGARALLFDNALSFDVAVYHIDWRDVQLTIRDLIPGVGTLQYTVNGGEAESEGVELSVALRPLQGTQISGWLAYNAAQITQVPTNVNETINVGDRLPYSPRWSGNVSASQDFAIGESVSAFIGGAISFVGDRRGRFFRNQIQSTFPGYTQVDLRVGVRWDEWAINAYINNLTDTRGVLRGGRDSLLSQQYIVTYTQPRTAGISISRQF